MDKVYLEVQQNRRAFRFGIFGAVAWFVTNITSKVSVQMRNPEYWNNLKQEIQQVEPTMTDKGFQMNFYFMLILVTFVAGILIYGLFWLTNMRKMKSTNELEISYSRRIFLIVAILCVVQCFWNQLSVMGGESVLLSLLIPAPILLAAYGLYPAMLTEYDAKQ